MNVIPADLKHGKNFKIGAFCVIGEGCVFGDNVEIANNTVIGNNVVLGDNTFVGNFCELGDHFKTGKNCIVQGRIRTAAHCECEDDVTIKYGTILTSKVLLKKNAFLGPNVITLGGTHTRETFHGTIIGSNTYIGAGSKIAACTEIGDEVVIGALSFVNKDVKESGIYAGVPAKYIKPFNFKG